METPKLTREQMIAAEIYSYSFDNYYDHLGIGNVRFDKLMPEAARTLERAADEGWPVSRIANALKVDEVDALDFAAAFACARQIVDAENPAEFFRNGVRASIETAVSEGLTDPDRIELLVTQICYRAADLGFVLKMRGEKLSRYSAHLRKEPGVDYGEGYFDEPEEDE